MNALSGLWLLFLRIFLIRLEVLIFWVSTLLLVSFSTCCVSNTITTTWLTLGSSSIDTFRNLGLQHCQVCAGALHLQDLRPLSSNRSASLPWLQCLSIYQSLLSPTAIFIHSIASPPLILSMFADYTNKRI